MSAEVPESLHAGRTPSGGLHGAWHRFYEREIRPLITFYASSSMQKKSIMVVLRLYKLRSTPVVLYMPSIQIDCCSALYFLMACLTPAIIKEKIGVKVSYKRKYYEYGKDIESFGNNKFHIKSTK